MTISINLKHFGTLLPVDTKKAFGPFGWTDIIGDFDLWSTQRGELEKKKNLHESVNLYKCTTIQYTLRKIRKTNQYSLQGWTSYWFWDTIGWAKQETAKLANFNSTDLFEIKNYQETSGDRLLAA